MAPTWAMRGQHEARREAVRAAMGRGLIALGRWPLVVAVALPLVAWPAGGKALPGGTARASDMILMQEPRTEFGGYGVAFLGMSLVSFAVAANDYNESEANITKAKKAYKNYRAATTAVSAVQYRDQTTTFSNRAQSYESTANAALVLGTLFALTSIAMFRYKGGDSTPILLSQNGIQLRLKF